MDGGKKRKNCSSPSENTGIDSKSIKKNQRVSVDASGKENANGDAAASPYKTDPVLYLNDECMIRVLSFLGNRKIWDGEDGESEEPSSSQEDKNDVRFENLSAFEAARFYFNLALVSRGWKNILDKCIAALLPGIDVDLRNISRDCDKAKASVSWLCKHKMIIQSFSANYSVDWTWGLVARMLQECDTSFLRFAHVRICVHLDPPAAEDSDETTLLNLQLDIQNSLARDCPKLKGLYAELNIEANQTNSADNFPDSPYINRALFAHPSVECMEIFVAFRQPVKTVKGTFFRTLTQNLPNLEWLSLAKRTATPPTEAEEDNEPNDAEDDNDDEPSDAEDANDNEPADAEDDNGNGHQVPVIQVESKSLLRLEVDGFGNKPVEFALNCPKLEVYQCVIPPGDAIAQLITPTSRFPESCVCAVVPGWESSHVSTFPLINLLLD